MYTFSAFTYIIIVHCQTGSICCLVHLVHVYEYLTCSISTQLNSRRKTWKMDINCPGKSWKMHIKRSWKVMETTFSVLYAASAILVNPNFFQNYTVGIPGVFETSASMYRHCLTGCHNNNISKLWKNG